MPAPAPDRFTLFCCDATIGFLVVAGAIYFLMRAFRKGRDQNRPPDDEE